MTSAIATLRSSRGARIYHIPLNLFSILSGYVHLAFANGVIARIDIGSRFGDDKDRMEAGVAYVRSEFGEITIW